MKAGKQVEGKAPTAGVNPAGAARGSGATPRDAEAAKMHRYKMPFRRTLKTDAVTYPIALCLECGKVIEPSAREYSKTEAHGKLFFAHEHELAFIILKQSNSGKRKVETRGNVPEQLIDVVRDAWLYLGASPESVEGIIDYWLNTKDYLDDPGFDPYDYPDFARDDPDWPCGAAIDPDFDPEYAGEW
jgi:hypothetical protein